MTDPLTPEDRALYDAFFVPYKEKFEDLRAAASPGADVSVDVCTVHAIKVMNAKEIDRRLAHITPGRMKVAVIEMLRQGNGELLASGAEPEHIEFLGKFAAEIAEQTTRLLLIEFAKDPPAPRIVSAVGVGVRVKRDDEDGAQ